VNMRGCVCMHCRKNLRAALEFVGGTDPVFMLNNHHLSNVRFVFFQSIL
jgi:hypothetical protein